MTVSQAELFKIGMELEMLEGEEVVDRLLVKRVGRGGVPLRDEIDVESLDLHITRLFTFVYFPDRGGWRMLFEDPLTENRCFSQRAPVYTIRPKLSTSAS